MSDVLAFEAKNVAKYFGKVKALDGASIKSEQGKIIGLLGPNGAGKTVLFRTLLGLMKPTGGSIVWKPGVKIGYVPQRFDIETDLPLTTREFFYLKGKGISESKIKTVLDWVGMPSETLKTRFSELSVGQRQRILVGWAAMNEPEILLFDEPTADIDISGQRSIYHLLHQIQDRIGFAVILISHDLSVVYRYADQVLCLNRKRICFGPPKNVLSAQQLMELYGGEHAFYEHLEKTLLNYYVYPWRSTRGAAIALGFGSIYNHSYSPNADWKQNFRDNTMVYRALKQIKKGEEITVNYNGEPDDKTPIDWFP